ncbi:PLP-dependent aminotransferase family protein [Rhizobiaceae bacterium BDR2-2]|uniref:PLP-dependent aminotransferase family protein n=1 Tax=Ectorhizobium quercum TaxID=2965071 RepID=A0AAE3SV59_9HYPH|nr:PLP-dependent aminotransferase family protein [Ectorhizobium quercum]MCX8997822.1 PLP-dependent aminotransferase family protein [Ectorhizobium quercum]
MTNWLPNISEGNGPLYLRLANAIETAISGGDLPAGAKLPPQRNLAYDLGVTIGTISRAYAAVHERGLVSGEVGRGTYVNDRKTPVPAENYDPVVASLGGTRAASVSDGQHRFDTTAAPDVGQSVVLERFISEIARERPLDIVNYSRVFPDHWFEAGVAWLSSNRWSPEAESIVPTLGAHAAIMSVITAMTAPGDKIVFENITYSQVSRSVTLAGRRIAIADTDANGIVPEDFEKVCAQQHPKIVFLMPSAQNPTCSILPLERRRAIADIARRYNVHIIEDNLYGAMRNDDLPMIAELAPDITFVIGGLSKSVAAGIRGGWVACPPHFASRVRIAHRLITGGQPFLLAELCARLVVSGEAMRIRNRCIAEITAREAMIRQILAGYEFESRPSIPFLWLKLPEPWLSGTFRIAALQEGVLVDDEDEFKPGRTDKVFHRIRIGFSTPATREELSDGLAILRRLLDNGETCYDSMA